MRPAPARCPICDSELNVVRLHCPSCDTSIEGQFSSGQFSHLSADQIAFITTFVRCEGKINRVEQEIGLSYPTIRNRLHEVIRAMGFEPGRDEAPDLGEEKRRTVLDDLDTGKISVEDAMLALRGEEAVA